MKYETGNKKTAATGLCVRNVATATKSASKITKCTEMCVGVVGHAFICGYEDCLLVVG